MIVKRNKKTPQFYYSTDTGMCVLSYYLIDDLDIVFLPMST